MKISSDRHTHSYTKFEDEPVGSKNFDEAPEDWSHWEKKICSHCGYPLGYANPSGACNHVYYPDNCKICKKAKHKDFIAKEEFDV